MNKPKKKIDNFTNRYTVSKTLQFELIPVGKTEENFNKRAYLELDKTRTEHMNLVKGYMDRTHKAFIETILKDFETTPLENLSEYFSFYNKRNKTEEEKREMLKIEANLRKQIANKFTKNSSFGSLFGKDVITTTLPTFLTDETEKEIVAEFKNYTTYFEDFHKNRKNLYDKDSKTTAISYRCINENLPKFIDNIAVFDKVANAFNKETMEEINATYSGLYGIPVEDVFTLDYFNFVLAQSGIDRYNSIIGGYSCDDGTKVKGINEYINLYNQQVAKKDRSMRLPLLKPLYKQMLSDFNSISFLPATFSSDNEVLKAINDFYIGNEEKNAEKTIENIVKLFSEFSSFDLSRIFVKNSAAITDISNSVFGNWSVIQNSWNKNYEEENPIKKKTNLEKYYEKQKKDYKNIESFSIEALQLLGESYGEEKGKISEYYSNHVVELANEINTAYKNVKPILSKPYESRGKLQSNQHDIELIKTFLDSIKGFERFIKIVMGTGKEEDKDELFYGEFITLYDNLAQVDKLYDMVRNYLTKKPYSKNKVQLTFENPLFLAGWVSSEEHTRRSILFRKNEKYYLGILEKEHNKLFKNFPYNVEEDYYEKMNYNFLPDPHKMLPKVFFAQCNLSKYQPSDHILKIKEKGTFKKGDNFNINDLHDYIDFCKESITKNTDWDVFEFKFKDTNEYTDISEFYRDVKNQGYKVNFVNVSASYVDNLVQEGKMYLFQLYNKDFSEFSKGTPNLHTMYFMSLFSEENLKDVVFKLNGQAKMFYREASIPKENQIIHPANQPIDNKNPFNPKKKSIFEYVLVKDKRYTRRQFSFHFPISINYRENEKSNLNTEIRKALKESNKNYVIGIDRGERNLLYVSVINKKGKIVEQKSLNIIEPQSNGMKHIIDYRELLDRKEKERENARNSWGTIENIKNIKEGYLGQAIYEICKLVIKYDAIIVMENLNSGFKNNRTKVEKSVYQTFETKLANKLNYLVDKNIIKGNGNVRQGFQLTNKDSMSGSFQNGIIFYVPAWNTSKIDPTTGFVNLFDTRYTNITAAKDFFSRFDDIYYNQKDNLFEFSFNYLDFPKTSTTYRTNWTVCTYGERIKTFRNSEKNGNWDNKVVKVTEEFKALFEEYKINYRKDLQKQIVAQTEKTFFEKLLYLFRLTLQMRNSISGNVDVDYIISPVRNENNEFYDSRDYKDNEYAVLPRDADANGAYNIARKGLMLINRMKETPDEDLAKMKLAITNAEWLEYAQQ